MRECLLTSARTSCVKSPGVPHRVKLTVAFVEALSSLFPSGDGVFESFGIASRVQPLHASSDESDDVDGFSANTFTSGNFGANLSQCPGDPPGEQDRNTFPSSVIELVSLPLVCKNWYQPAQSILYESIFAQSWIQFTLLYESLLYTKTENGFLVRHLNLDIMQEENALLPHLTVRLIAAMPRLVRLQAAPQLYGNLRLQACFQSLQEINFDLSSDNRFALRCIPSGSNLPPNLLKLAILAPASGNITPEQPDTMRVSLRRLATLSIQDYPDTADRGTDIIVWQLPIMPALTRLSLLDCEVDGSVLLCPAARLLQEVAPTLKHLVLTFRSHARGVLGGHLLQLENLETLSIFYRATDLETSTIENEIPQGLLELEFAWLGPVALGLPLLTRLQESHYLPQLRKCPRIGYILDERYVSSASMETLQMESTRVIQKLGRRPHPLDCYIASPSGPLPDNTFSLLPRYKSFSNSQSASADVNNH